MDIKKRIQELSLDQKAKLYFMGLVRKGIIDRLPDDPKAAYIRDMMDKEDPKMDPEIRSDFDDPIFENLTEIAVELGYLKENMPKEVSDYKMLRSFQKDELLDDLGDIIAKYVKDPDDVDRELDRFDDGGFDNMSNMVTANLLRDPEYKAWAKKFHSIKENNNMRKVIRKIIKEQNFDQRLAKAMGMSDDEFQDKVASRDVSGESMSNADIGALQKLVGNYSLEKILKTIAIIADRGGKNDEAFEIENFLKTFNKE